MRCADGVRHFELRKALKVSLVALALQGTPKVYGGGLDMGSRDGTQAYFRDTRFSYNSNSTEGGALVVRGKSKIVFEA